MLAKMISPSETWQRPGKLDLVVLDFDGEYAHLFYADGPWEIDITSGTPDEDGRRLIVPVGFHSKEQAERAGKVLAEAFAAVREIQSEPAPNQAICAHQPMAMRFSRKLGKVWICQSCTAHLGEVKETP